MDSSGNAVSIFIYKLLRLSSLRSSHSSAPTFSNVSTDSELTLQKDIYRVLTENVIGRNYGHLVHQGQYCCPKIRVGFLVTLNTYLDGGSAVRFFQIYLFILVIQPTEHISVQVLCSITV